MHAELLDHKRSTTASNAPLPTQTYHPLLAYGWIVRAHLVDASPALGKGARNHSHMHHIWKGITELIQVKDLLLVNLRDAIQHLRLVATSPSTN